MTKRPSSVFFIRMMLLYGPGEDFVDGAVLKGRFAADPAAGRIVGIFVRENDRAAVLILDLAGYEVSLGADEGIGAAGRQAVAVIGYRKVQKVAGDGDRLAGGEIDIFGLSDEFVLIVGDGFLPDLSFARPLVLADGLQFTFMIEIRPDYLLPVVSMHPSLDVLVIHSVKGAFADETAVIFIVITPRQAAVLVQEEDFVQTSFVIIYVGFIVHRPSVRVEGAEHG
jgi:hypothetical protein